MNGSVRYPRLPAPHFMMMPTQCETRYPRNLCKEINNEFGFDQQNYQIKNEDYGFLFEDNKDNCENENGEVKTAEVQQE